MDHARRGVIQEILDRMGALEETTVDVLEDPLEALERALIPSVSVELRSREEPEPASLSGSPLAHTERRTVTVHVIALQSTPALRDQLSAEVEIALASSLVALEQRLVQTSFDRKLAGENAVYAAELQYEIVYGTQSDRPVLA